MGRADFSPALACRKSDLPQKTQNFSVYAKCPRQSFAARRRQNQFKSQNSGDMRLGILTSQPASVCALRMRRSGLHPLSKMQAFLRSVSSFLDTLKGRAEISPALVHLISLPLPASPRRRKVRSFRNGLKAIPHAASSLLLSQSDPLALGSLRGPIRVLPRQALICSRQMNCPGIKVLPTGQNAWMRTLLPPQKMGRAEISPALANSISLPLPASPWRPRWPSPGRREERPRSGQSGR